MGNKKFLEEYPLYRKFIDKDIPYSFNQHTPQPAIHMYCKLCQSEQTFNMNNQYYEVDQLFEKPVIGKTVRASYLCTSCQSYTRLFFIEFGEIIIQEGKDTVTKRYMRKVGQNPPWNIAMDKELEKMLGTHADAYRKGLECESQGYGIGAYAYYRRVVENIIDQLLESIIDLVDGGEKVNYEEKLQAVKKEKVAENKINLIEDLLPKSLQIDGINPLKELYAILSRGIHELNDEDCLRKAEGIRSILVFLVNQVMRTKNDKKTFTEGMKKILNK